MSGSDETVDRPLEVGEEGAYRLLFERNPLPMWVFDRETLRFLAVNEAALAAYGYSRERFAEMTILDIRPGEDRVALREDVSRGVRGYDPPREWRHVHADGEIRTVEISAHDLEFDGRPARLVLANDVTDRARAREALEQHAAELEERVAERTRELKESNSDLEAFAYSVSHDLRSPLRTMSGFAHALAEDHGDALGEDGRGMAERIVAAAGRMDALIGDLLAYGRVSRREMEIDRVSLDSIVASALSQIESDLVGAEVEVDRDLGAVAGHYATLVQVVGNLASNAAKFIPPDRRARLRIRAAAGPGEVTLRVEDNGIGIAPEHRERIFRVFERLHERDQFPGTGVGLAIVRRGVERMGGRVEVESVPGEGSAFLVTLPEADAGR